MSRIGKQPVVIPEKVTVNVANGRIRAEGPKGKLDFPINAIVDVKVEDKSVVCRMKEGSPIDQKSKYGLMRSLIANMVRGVSQGFTRDLEINGVGFRAAVKGKTLELALGFSHPVIYTIPEGITVQVEKQTKITISGVDRQLVGQTAAEIRQFRLPEPYKGKGIKYAGETIRRKAGKAAAGAGSTGGA